MSRRHRSSGFPYADRAQAVEAARRACIDATGGCSERRRTDAMRAAFAEASRNFHAALASAYPPDFWSNLERLRSGDLDSVDAAIEFLEADPMFFRSGYTKSKIATALRRVSLRPEQKERIIDAVLSMIDRRDGREYREIFKLSSTVADERLISELKLRLDSPDCEVSRRARWMLNTVKGLVRERRSTLQA